jgi:hypothetical protein
LPGFDPEQNRFLRATASPPIAPTRLWIVQMVRYDGTGNRNYFFDKN